VLEVGNNELIDRDVKCIRLGFDPFEGRSALDHERRDFEAEHASAETDGTPGSQHGRLLVFHVGPLYSTTAILLFLLCPLERSAESTRPFSGLRLTRPLDGRLAAQE
jgi:hypothetical protein